MMINLYTRKENGRYIAEYSTDMTWEPKYIIESYINDIYEFLKIDPNDELFQQELSKLFRKFLEDNIASLKVGGSYIISYNPSGKDQPPFKSWIISEKSEQHN